MHPRIPCLGYFCVGEQVLWACRARRLLCVSPLRGPKATQPVLSQARCSLFFRARCLLLRERAFWVFLLRRAAAMFTELHRPIFVACVRFLPPRKVPQPRYSLANGKCVVALYFVWSLHLGDYRRPLNVFDGSSLWNVGSWPFLVALSLLEVRWGRACSALCCDLIVSGFSSVCVCFCFILSCLYACKVRFCAGRLGE